MSGFTITLFDTFGKDGFAVSMLHFPVIWTDFRNPFMPACRRLPDTPATKNVIPANAGIQWTIQEGNGWTHPKNVTRFWLAVSIPFSMRPGFPRSRG
jgi:hypothetical protein